MLEANKKTEAILHAGKTVIPKPVFHLFQPLYHWVLAWFAAFVYGFPGHSMKIIGVTGTKGKSTTSYMIAKIFEDQGKSVALIGSLGYKINDREWPNTLKMTMPGRFKLQQFLAEARKAKVDYLVLEVTSEGIAQHRLNGINIDCAVFTNLHKEHIESHGSFENYLNAKLELFRRTKHIHIINGENQFSDEFMAIPAKKTVIFGLKKGDITQKILGLNLKLAGEFNIYNALAAIAAIHVYGLDFLKAKETVEAIPRIPGRMEFLEEGQPFDVVIDYAHTPESLEAVYQTLKPVVGKLIAVFGSTGGGRDTWKRPVYGEIAARYCDEIILTNEDPYDEDPEKILDDIDAGIQQNAAGKKTRRIIDRGEAIYTAVQDARPGDVVVITGKGSESIMAVSEGRHIPWSDRETALKVLMMRGFHHER